MSSNVKNNFLRESRKREKSKGENRKSGTWQKIGYSTVFPKESADLVNQSDRKRKTVPFPIDYTKNP